MKKRFTETVSTGIVTDNLTGKEYNCEMRISDQLLEVINNLHEENMFLKEERQEDIKDFEKLLKKNQKLEKLVKSLQKELNNCEEDYIYEEYL